MSGISDYIPGFVSESFAYGVSFFYTPSAPAPKGYAEMASDQVKALGKFAFETASSAFTTYAPLTLGATGAGLIGGGYLCYANGKKREAQVLGAAGMTTAVAGAILGAYKLIA